MRPLSFIPFQSHLNARVLRCVFSVLAWAMCGLAMGQVQNSGLDETDTRAVTKANFLYHFAASNEWPESAKEGEFHLSIVGNERLYAELIDKYAMKMIGAQPLRVHGYARPEDLPLAGFHHLVYCDVGGRSTQPAGQCVRGHTNGAGFGLAGWFGTRRGHQFRCQWQSHSVRDQCGRCG